MDSINGLLERNQLKMNELRKHPVVKKEMRNIGISLILMIISTGILRTIKEFTSVDGMVYVSYIMIGCFTIFNVWRCLKIGEIERALKNDNFSQL